MWHNYRVSPWGWLSLSVCYANYDTHQTTQFVLTRKDETMSDKNRQSAGHTLLEELESRVLLSTTTVFTDNFEYSNLTSFLSNWQVNQSQNRAWGPNTIARYGGSYSIFSSDDYSLPCRVPLRPKRMSILKATTCGIR